jgi:hypothetical protein
MVTSMQKKQRKKILKEGANLTFSSFLSIYTTTFLSTTKSYLILAPAKIKAESEEKKAAQACFEEIQLDPDRYRLGHTKARYLKYLHIPKPLRED